MPLGVTFPLIVSNCCWVYHSLLAIFIKYPDKRHRIPAALLALRFKNEADPGFIDGSRKLAERVARTLAQDAAEAEKLAEELLQRYAAGPDQLQKWRWAVSHGQAPYFQGLNRQDIAFVLEPWLSLRLGVQASWERLAARKRLVLEDIFYHLLRGRWDEETLSRWLQERHQKLLAAAMNCTEAAVEALEEAGAMTDAERAAARASYLCGACDSPDLLRAGESCRLCGNTDTVALTTA